MSHDAATAALHAGAAGLLAMAIQILIFMWLRTAAAYQFRYGNTGGLLATLRHLWAVGGIRRLYAGVQIAVVYGPLCRFCDTAANGFALQSIDAHRPLWQRTAVASLLAASMRFAIYPLEAIKTSQQVDGTDVALWVRVRRDGCHVLYFGAGVALPAVLLSHYPWYLIHNLLDASVPNAADSALYTAARNATIGMLAAIAADCCTNVLRVLKTMRQTDPHAPSYGELIETVVEQDGMCGFFLRGLSARLAASVLQSAFFNTAWHYIAAHHIV